MDSIDESTSYAADSYARNFLISSIFERPLKNSNFHGDAVSSLLFVSSSNSALDGPWAPPVGGHGFGH